MIILLMIANTAIAIYRSKLIRSLAAASTLPASDQEISPTTLISVIVPAYNEVDNIDDCIETVLASTDLQAPQLEVIVIDDRSTDATLRTATQLQQQLEDPRLKVIAGKSRPENEVWLGKNWACAQAAGEAKGDWLLFVDADVRLKHKVIETAVATAEAEKIDLLSLAPAIECDCLAEWLVQPIMFNNMAIGFDYGRVNDPKSDAAFAMGPFMLFRRSAYEQIGGHRAVAEEVVEDVELARAIKAHQSRLRVLLGANWVSVRMYRDWGSLWEGWTKNLYLGARRNFWAMLYFASSMVIVYTLPIIGLSVGLGRLILGTGTGWNWILIALALVAIAFHYDLRRLGGAASSTPTSYWWLNSIGGTVLAAAAIASIIKVETGWGWTWRGRKLFVTQQNG